jgi:hypothetical protein
MQTVTSHPRLKFALDRIEIVTHIPAVRERHSGALGVTSNEVMQRSERAGREHAASRPLQRITSSYAPPLFLDDIGTKTRSGRKI